MLRNELQRRNIDNLTTLYTHMGLMPPDTGLPERLNVSASWPHRYWFDWDAPAATVEELIAKSDHLPVRAVVPVWPWPNGCAARLERALSQAGFVRRSVLNAMILDLDAIPGAGETDQEMRAISEPEDIATWTEVCGRGFGYAIDEAVIHRISSVPGLTLYLAFEGGEPAATALTLKTGDTIGLHQLGVPIEFRGKGVGRRTMEHIMAGCYASGCQYATLQASAAGEGIYRKLGFEVQFPIHSYQRKVAE
jgi:predicted GNAT family acetyltransferase